VATTFWYDGHVLEFDRFEIEALGGARVCHGSEQSERRGKMRLDRRYLVQLTRYKVCEET